MVKFMAIKIHYDHRPRLPPHLKYSDMPTAEEYQEYLDLYHDEGVGGEGFHECLNYQIPESGSVQIYLPPTCQPDKKFFKEEFVIFSLTYKGDREMSSHIIGVHAATRILSKEGIIRTELSQLDDFDELTYNAEAPADFVTLLNPPLSYECEEGIYTPAYKFWGYGLRYLEQHHAARIVATSLKEASLLLRRASASKAVVIQRQIQVLRRIFERYFLDEFPHEISDKMVLKGSVPPTPDPEVGRLGEKFVYEEELQLVKKLGLGADQVEWTSQSVPQSPFDIKSVRKVGGHIRDHFIEVKSSKRADEINVFISSGQVDFFVANEDRATFKFVTVSYAKECLNIRELSWQELNDEFKLIPIKFRLARD